MQKYVFREYNPVFPEFFVREKEKLQNIFDTLIKIEHVGSTAIPGLGGKGIIDIAIGVPQSDLLNSKSILAGAGYEFRAVASNSERLFFRRDCPDNSTVRRVHIHLIEFGGQDWQEMITFRDYLLIHPKAVREYTELKKRAVKEAQGDGEVYRSIKKEFIENITNYSNNYARNT